MKDNFGILQKCKFGDSQKINFDCKDSRFQLLAVEASLAQAAGGDPQRAIHISIYLVC